MSLMFQPLNIVSWGMVSSLALSAAQNGFFLRAGKNHFRLSPFVDTWGERVTMAYLATLPQSMVGRQRLLHLAMEAIHPALTHLEPGRFHRIRYALALPERFAAGVTSHLTDEGEQFLRSFVNAVPEWLGQILPPDFLSPASVECWPSGRAAGVMALGRAAQWLDRGEADLVVVGGVDSDYQWDILDQLMRDDRVLTQDNLDGFIPGEGAAFVAISRDVSHPASVRCIAFGSGWEPINALSGQVCRATGITEALKTAVEPLRARSLRSNYWMSDLTHESYGVKEFQTVIARFGDVLGTGTVLQTPLRELGNLGAATLPAFWALAAEAWLRGYAPDQFAVCTAASNIGWRAATLLEGNPA